jgi:hypothetical protein
VCGRAGRFDLHASSTGERVDCAKVKQVPNLRCESCAAKNGCTNTVHNTEGSAIKGHLVHDVAHFLRFRTSAAPPHQLAGGNASGGADKMPVPVYFGCQTLESGMFQRQRADGILGLQASRQRGRVPSMLSALIAQHRAPNAFSLCLSDTRGLFLLGGAPRAARLQAARALTLPMEGGARALFTLRLNELRVSRAGGGANASSFVKLPGFASSALHLRRESNPQSGPARAAC